MNTTKLPVDTLQLLCLQRGLEGKRRQRAPLVWGWAQVKTGTSDEPSNALRKARVLWMPNTAVCLRGQAPEPSPPHASIAKHKVASRNLTLEERSRRLDLTWLSTNL